MSLADLSAAQELDNVKLLGWTLEEWPRTKAWLHRMIDQQPVCLELSSEMRKTAQITSTLNNLGVADHVPAVLARQVPWLLRAFGSARNLVIFTVFLCIAIAYLANTLTL